MIEQIKKTAKAKGTIIIPFRFFELFMSFTCNFSVYWCNYIARHMSEACGSYFLYFSFLPKSSISIFLMVLSWERVWENLIFLPSKSEISNLP